MSFDPTDHLNDDLSSDASFARPSFGTLCAHAGGAPDPHTGALVPGVVSATTFAQASPGLSPAFCYGRTGNPTRQRLEEALASLEGAQHASAFASGLAAVDTLLHTLSAGDHVVASQDLYGGCYRQFTKVWSRLGIRFTFVDATDLSQVQRAFTRSTRYLWLETPSNPLLRITPLAEACALARQAGVRTVVDNTFATPLLQRPLELGADIVLHSTTKYIGGHCDVLGGALLTNNATLGADIRYLQNALGAVPSPWDCSQLLRGIRTLELRLERHCTSAQRLAEALQDAPGVEQVIYPGLRSHPGHQLAAQQMSAFGGIITLRLAGGRPAVERFARTTRLWTLAESLGGFKSLWCHPPTMTHASVDPPERERIGITEGTIRLSVGLENAADLLADLRAALAAAEGATVAA